MGKLVLSIQGKILGEFPLNRERITIGRLQDNDIHVDNLAVSGHHALVLTILNDSFLEDLDSTNGTFVNKKPIKKYALKHGDVIGIGKHELKYINEAATSSPDFEQTLIMRPSAANTESLASQPSSKEDAAMAEAAEKAVAEATPTATQAAAGLPLARLQVLNGANAGRELELTKALTTLGKPGVQVAAISRRQQGYYLVHVESKNNVYPKVNGDPIGPQARLLKDGDTVEIAGTKMGVFMIE
ncbi:MAG: FHA domain-containing protein [Proteobacteria bacterium]|nr:MAG: FHA domain-containing protein [Pseudomonadota bacterium]QKK11330.1 MAG: FHA domain-containing protein [Pseudomonadota bacterium]